MSNELQQKPMTSEDLTRVSMKNYLSSPNIDKMIDSMLHEKKGAFVATVTSLVNGSDKLMACNKQTVLMAALKAVGMNLPVDPALGFAWIIPYGEQAQFQIGYKGYVQLALRTNDYKAINSIEVREGEFKGRDSLGEPVVLFSEESDRLKKKIIGYLAGFETVSGMRKVEYWPINKVEEHASRFSQGYKSFKRNGPSKSAARSGNMSNPWETDFDSMAKKTVLKNVLSKYGKLSIELQNAVRYDQAVISIDENTGSEIIDYPDNPNTDIPESTTIKRDKQDELLSKYGPGTVKEALYNSDLKDISQIQEAEYEDFCALCDGIQKSNESGEQIQIK